MNKKIIWIFVCFLIILPNVKALTDCSNTPITSTTTLQDDYQTEKGCFDIEEDNIILDCNGNKITYLVGDALNPWPHDAVEINGKDNITVQNCIFENFYESIDIKDASSINLNNNKFYFPMKNYANAKGIYLKDATNLRIDNNEFHTRGNIYSSGKKGIFIEGSLTNASIFDNEFTRTADTAWGVAIYAIPKQGTSVVDNLLIERNIFDIGKRGNRYEGNSIWFLGELYDQTGNIEYKNIFIRNNVDMAKIEIGNSENLEVRDNSLAAIEFPNSNNVQIINNNITQKVEGGDPFVVKTRNSNDINIIGNTIISEGVDENVWVDSEGDGYYRSGIRVLESTEVTISNNEIGSTEVIMRKGIDTSSSQDVVCSNNELILQGGSHWRYPAYGISLGENAEADSNTIIFVGEREYQDGIRIKSNSVVSGNRVYGTGKENGIEIKGDNVVIFNNLIKKSRGNGIYINGSNMNITFNLVKEQRENLEVVFIGDHIITQNNFIGNSNYDIWYRQQSPILDVSNNYWGGDYVGTPYEYKNYIIYEPFATEPFDTIEDDLVFEEEEPEIEETPPGSFIKNNGDEPVTIAVGGLKVQRKTETGLWREYKFMYGAPGTSFTLQPGETHNLIDRFNSYPNQNFVEEPGEYRLRLYLSDQMRGELLRNADGTPLEVFYYFDVVDELEA